MTEPLTPSEQRQALAKLGVPEDAIARAMALTGSPVSGGNDWKRSVSVPIEPDLRGNYARVDPRVLTFPIRFVLPWSHLCSDNRKYTASVQRGTNGKLFPRLLLTKEYREAKRKTRDVARDAMTVDGLTFRPMDRPLSLIAHVWVPDNRPHDVVNFAKCTLDGLEKLIYTNDKLLHHVLWERIGIDVDRPRVDIAIEPY